MTTNPKTIIYHSDCLDGFTAAWVLWRRFQGEPTQFIPAQYGEDPPWVLVDGRDTYVVDFSYPRPQLEEMKRRANLLLVLDHHATAEEELAGLPYAVFDMGRSGAGLTWDWAFFGQHRPWLVNYVEDGDLWLFSYPSSKEVRVFLQRQSKTFENWQRLSEESLENILPLARVAYTDMEAYVEARARRATVQAFKGMLAVVVEAGHQHGSELLHYLLQKHPRCDVAIRAEHDGGQWVYSVRSRLGEAKLLAERLGGGGHSRAAGFRSQERLHV